MLKKLLFLPIKMFFTALIIVLLLAIFLVLRFQNDVWFCEDGAWVERGAPTEGMPEGECSWYENYNLLRLF